MTHVARFFVTTTKEPEGLTVINKYWRTDSTRYCLTIDDPRWVPTQASYIAVDGEVTDDEYGIFKEYEECIRQLEWPSSAASIPELKEVLLEAADRHYAQLRQLVDRLIGAAPMVRIVPDGTIVMKVEQSYDSLPHSATYSGGSACSGLPIDKCFYLVRSPVIIPANVGKVSKVTLMPIAQEAIDYMEKIFLSVDTDCQSLPVDGPLQEYLQYSEKHLSAAVYPSQCIDQSSSLSLWRNSKCAFDLLDPTLGRMQQGLRNALGNFRRMI